MNGTLPPTTRRRALAATLALGLVATIGGLVPPGTAGGQTPAARPPTTSPTTSPADRPAPGDPAAASAIIVPTTLPPPTTTTSTTTTTVTPPTIPPGVVPPLVGDLPAAEITPMTEPDCTSGRTRPAGAIPPGYLYSPTSFNDQVADPQPDDTFAADASGHQTFTGRLTTRFVGDQEQFLVCAHVGTNTVDDALTALPTTGPGAHPATLTMRISTIDAAGTVTSYDIGDPSIVSAVFPYSASTDRHEGFAGAWIPFTPKLHEPGFTVRAEVRGTPATPGGGTSLVMGADEVFVHLGPSPVARNQQVDQAFGVALDDGVIGERASDPGPDDLSALLAPKLGPALQQAIAKMAPIHISKDFDWDFSYEFAVAAGGDIDALNFYPRATTIDVVNFRDDEARLQIHLAGELKPEMTLYPRAAGLVSILAGSCQVRGSVSVSADLGAVVDLSPDGTRPAIKAFVLGADATVNSVTATGDLLALGLVIPYHKACESLEGNFKDGMAGQMKDRMSSLSFNPDVNKTITDKVNERLDPSDLATGPLSTTHVDLGGTGFGIDHVRYHPTALPGHVGGSVWIWSQGADLAADAAVTDQGGARFPYSYRPSATGTVVNETHARTRKLTVSTRPEAVALAGGAAAGASTAPGSSAPRGSSAAGTARRLIPGLPMGDIGAFGTTTVDRDFDMGLVLNGATVNQLVRALTAGGPRSIVGGPVGSPGILTRSRAAAKAGVRQQTVDVGLFDILTKVDSPVGPLDVAIHPSVAPMYLPTPPQGWPTGGAAKLYVPSLRISIPFPGIATMASDLRVGVDASIDTTTNHLVPRVAGVQVTTRFLRLGPTTNSIKDPAVEAISVVAIAGDKVRDAVPARLASALSPIAIPDLAGLLASPGVPAPVLTNLSVNTVGGGHLGIHFDLDPNPARVTTSVTFDGDGSSAAGSYTVHASPTRFPGSGDYQVSWTVRDGTTNAVLYRSPVGGESNLDVTLPAAPLKVTVTDPCLGERHVSVRFEATVTRNGVTNSGSANGAYDWDGAPTKPLHLCEQEP